MGGEGEGIFVFVPGKPVMMHCQSILFHSLNVHWSNAKHQWYKLLVCLLDVHVRKNILIERETGARK